MSRVEVLESSAGEADEVITGGDPTADVDGILRRSWEMDGTQRRSGSVTWKAVLIQGIVLLVFLICGGCVFWVLEGSRNAQQQQVSEQMESITLATGLINNVTRHLGLEENNNCSFNAELTEMLRRLEKILLSDKLFGNSSSADTSPHIWNVPGSIFFAVTIVTTIGYGNVVPVTPMGRVFCCLYALLGIPLCLVFLVNIGEKLNSSTRPLDRRLKALLRPRLVRPLRAVLIVAIGTVVFMVVPSLVFCHLQEWKFGTALYFSFITLSTIGFGDYVAGINYFGPHRPVYRILVAIWIFLGLAWLAGIVSSIQETFQNLAKEVEAKSTFRHSKDKKAKPLLRIEESRPTCTSEVRSTTPSIHCCSITTYTNSRSPAPYAIRPDISSRNGRLN